MVVSCWWQCTCVIQSHQWWHHQWCNGTYHYCYLGWRFWQRQQSFGDRDRHMSLWHPFKLCWKVIFLRSPQSFTALPDALRNFTETSVFTEADIQVMYGKEKMYQQWTTAAPQDLAQSTTSWARPQQMFESEIICNVEVDNHMLGLSVSSCSPQVFACVVF